MYKLEIKERKTMKDLINGHYKDTEIKGIQKKQTAINKAEDLAIHKKAMVRVLDNGNECYMTCYCNQEACRICSKRNFSIKLEKVQDIYDKYKQILLRFEDEDLIERLLKLHKENHYATRQVEPKAESFYILTMEAILRDAAIEKDKLTNS